MSLLNKIRDLDFYRRLPKDLTETTPHGAWLSLAASFFMLILFVCELWAFLSLQTTSNVVIDSDKNNLMRINFNISIPSIACEFAVISVVDVLGTRTENVSRNINKWQLDADGMRRKYEGRNTVQVDLLHDVHHDLDELHANGVHAVPMDESSFDDWLKGHHYTFVNFYAPWCIWCQRLEPVWEALAERVEEESLPVSIIKVDCVANAQLCTTQQIQAFPNLRLFKDDAVQPPDYRNDRTLESMLEFLKSRVSVDEQLAQLHPDQQREHREKQLQMRDDHPGCMMTGFLLVNKVPVGPPGNASVCVWRVPHIQARYPPPPPLAFSLSTRCVYDLAPINPLSPAATCDAHMQKPLFSLTKFSHCLH